MDNQEMTFRESLFMFALFLAVGAIIACSLAVNAIAASLPLIVLSLGVSGSLLLVTGTHCLLKLRQQRLRELERLYQVKAPKVGLIENVRRKLLK